jgi:hypothetical protein
VLDTTLAEFFATFYPSMDNHPSPWDLELYWMPDPLDDIIDDEDMSLSSLQLDDTADQ